MNSGLFSIRTLSKVLVLFILLLTCFGTQHISTVQAQEAGSFIRTLVQVSVSPSGLPGNGTSVGGSLTPDDHYIVFESSASNLVEGDSNTSWDVFVRDLMTETTSRVSVDSDGVQGNNHSVSPSISTDGQYIAFQSDASNLVTNDTNDATDIFLHDMLSGETTRVSVDSNGDQANGFSENPSISADGRYVVFTSSADNLVTGDLNSTSDVFLRDQQTGETSLISIASNGTQANGSSINARISSNGRYAVFESNSNNLSTLDPDIITDLYLRDLQSEITSLVSVNSSGVKGNDSSRDGQVTSDGRYVLFTSSADNLVSGDNNDFSDAFVHDMQTGSTIRISVSSTGQEGVQASFASAISADGRYILFSSGSSNLVTGDSNNYTDGFIHDMETGATTRVTLGSDGQQGNRASHPMSITDDVRSIAFWSEATNLIPDQIDSIEDVYVSFGPHLVYMPFIKRSMPLPGAFTKSIPQNGSIGIFLDQSIYWNYSSGAVSYEWCLDETNNNTCDTSWHNNGLSQNVAVWSLVTLKYNTTYFWQVRAVNAEGNSTLADGGTWWSFDTKMRPKAGFWFDDYTGTYFFVTPDQNYVREFSIYVYIDGCYDGWISRTIPAGDVGIDANNYFSFSGSYYATGTFATTTTASGTLGLNYFPLCGTYWIGGPYPWNAVWIDSSQPTSMSANAQAIRDASRQKPAMTSPGLEYFPAEKSPEATPIRR